MKAYRYNGIIGLQHIAQSINRSCGTLRKFILRTGGDIDKAVELTINARQYNKQYSKLNKGNALVVEYEGANGLAEIATKFKLRYSSLYYNYAEQQYPIDIAVKRSRKLCAPKNNPFVKIGVEFNGVHGIKAIAIANNVTYWSIYHRFKKLRMPIKQAVESAIQAKEKRDNE